MWQQMKIFYRNMDSSLMKKEYLCMFSNLAHVSIKCALIMSVDHAHSIKLKIEVGMFFS